MLPAAPRRSPDALTVLWTQEADGTDVDTGTADHFDKIFTNDPEPRGGVWWWMHHSWRGVVCLGLVLVGVCVGMRWRVWWLVSRLRRWLGIWGAVVGR